MLTARNWVGTSTVSSTLTVTLPLRASPTSSAVSGTGISATISAAVDVTVSVQAYDETSTIMTTGGYLYFVHVYDRCAVTTSYYCEETSLSTNILDPPIFKQLSDNSDGTYTVNY